MSPMHLRQTLPNRLPLAVATLAGLLLGACAPTGPQTSRLTMDDLDVTVFTMVDSLAASEFLAERRPDSEPIYVTIHRVENLTDDVIPAAEQWMLVTMLQSAMPVQELARQRNVYFQIPPEQHRRLQEMGFDSPLSAGPRTTHVMRALFLSAPRAVREGRQGHVTRYQSAYYLEYSIEEIQSRQTVWTDRFEFKREAVGLLID